MAIATFSRDDLMHTLDTLGVSEADCVLLHSSLMHIGRFNGCDAHDMPGAIIEVLLEVLEANGTLLTLAPFYDYSNKGQPFDTRRSPVSPEVGVLNAAVAAHPEAERSANPMFSLAGIGKLAGHICNGPNASAFGAESAWDRAVKSGAKMVLLGSSIERFTLVRYIEQRVGVPYLFVKLFCTPVLRDGVALGYPVTALLRYLHLSITYRLAPFGARLSEAGVMREAPLGGGMVKVIDAAEAVAEGIDAAQEDVHFFLAAPPNYVDAEFPIF